MRSQGVACVDRRGRGRVGVNAPCCEPVTICIAMCLIAKCEPLQLSHALTLSNAISHDENACGFLDGPLTVRVKNMCASSFAGQAQAPPASEMVSGRQRAYARARARRSTRSPRHARRPLPACLMHLGLGLPRASALAPPSLSSAPSPRTRPVSAAHLTPRCSAPAPWYSSWHAAYHSVAHS